MGQIVIGKGLLSGSAPVNFFVKGSCSFLGGSHKV